MEDNSKSAELLKWVWGALGLGVLASVGVALGVGGTTGLMIAFIIVLVLLVLVGGYLLWQHRKKKQDSDRLQNGIKQQGAQPPIEIKDPKRQAEYEEEVRAKFQKGIDVYDSRGKDIYSVPWFVIIGESGSGKTEAIRHSNLDFPAGLNDPLQGTGGTINMDWWFTNHGVILDTAGKVVFPEMGGENVKWQEFLKLLNKNRRHCPINGLLLVLSVDSLIADSAAKIADKAGKIARQLDLIQRTLDIRFPVSVLVTKCDKLTGFREFFEQIDDPELQDQMLGWSNPDPLDASFRPDLVDQHLGQIVQRLRKRRLGLLRDPQASGGPRVRRADEVDALYALPKSLLFIAPRLRRYLETIFMAGQFSANPVFLRGIYFTSAMQLGADMDEAVWSALGRATTESPTSGASPHDLGRPFFLRHVFLEKIFREWGLVTRDKNTQLMLFRRKIKLMGAAAACMLLVLLVGLIGKVNLDTEIGGQKDFWKMAATNGITNPTNTWYPIVVSTTKGVFEFEGDKRVFRDASIKALKETNLVQFHQALRKHAETPLKTSWIFLPAKLFINSGVWSADRQKAQRVVFENSVVRPLIDNTRRKMKGPPETFGPADEQGFQRDALESLIRLETEIARGKHPLSTTNTNVVADHYLLPYLHYLTETTNLSGAGTLAEVFRRTYKDGWPPRGLGDGEILVKNEAVDKGLQRFFENTRRANKVQAEQISYLDAIVKKIEAFESEEKKWQQAAERQMNIDHDLFIALNRAKEDLDLALTHAKTHGLFASATNTLDTHLTEIRIQGSLSARNAINKIKDVMKAETEPLTNALFADIRYQLNSFLTGLTESVGLGNLSRARIGDLQAHFLRICGSNRMDRSYEFRFRAYTQAYQFGQSPLPEVANEVGSKWRFLTTLTSQAEAIRSNSASYSSECHYSSEMRQIRDHLLTSEEKIGSNFVSQYAQYVAQQLQRPGFPIMRDGEKELNLEGLRDMGKFVQQAAADLSSSIPNRYQAPALKQAHERVDKCGEILEFLLDSTNGLRQFALKVEKKDVPRTRWGLSVSADVNAQEFNISNGKEFPPLSLFEPLVIVSMPYPGSGADQKFRAYPPAEEGLRQWTVLRLIAAAISSRDKSVQFDSSVWKWNLKVDPKDDKEMMMQLIFDKPLSPFKKWPTSKDW